MLFKSNKFFDLISKKKKANKKKIKKKIQDSETSFPKIDITEKICDHVVEY